jgi:hypothetical protein
MKRIHIILIVLICGITLLLQAVSLTGGGVDQLIPTLQGQRVADWRKERDEFLKSHERSPLTPGKKRNFKGLEYYPFDPQYVFSGKIECHIPHVIFNDPKYHATFLTNKGTSKRYIRYGKFHFRLGDKECSMEIYKSILSDFLFIPFMDSTNGKETYEGGRYIDAEVLVGYKMVLDFNMAYNPPCAYNDKLVCIIPPRENRLDSPIPAGEKKFRAF